MATSEDKKEWLGLISTCNMCGSIIANTFIDGKTKKGYWAIMCPECFKKYGIGLGTGKGQRYKKHWIKEDE